jgi:uncharacterized membrane protein YphA (DoxX/SURF4 family)
MTPPTSSSDDPPEEPAPTPSATGWGRYLYGAAAILLGAIGVRWDDFAVTWQRVGETAPHHGSLAYLAAVVEILGGLALLWRPTARLGAGVMSMVFGIFVLLWIPSGADAPHLNDRWGNFFEELSAFLGGLTLFAMLAPAGSAWARRTVGLTRLYGLCPISFGLVHFIYFGPVAAWVPPWLPPGPKFWAAATGTFFLLSAAALISGLLARLAARLLTVMIIGFGIFIWIPKAVATPNDHFVWSGNGIEFALAGAAWIVADALSTRPSGQRQPPPPQGAETSVAS